MNNIPVSLFLGPLFIIALFILCIVTVAGIKILYLYIKRTPVKEKPVVARTKPPSSAVSNKPVRSIEINPDEVDKIYVKKIS